MVGGGVEVVEVVEVVVVGVVVSGRSSPTQERSKACSAAIARSLASLGLVAVLVEVVRKEACF